jgi:5-hydroxyisourate hydrolase
METPARPPITCQITDTLTGKPAANIPVTLTLLSSSLSHTHHYSFHGRTNFQGQMDAEWVPQPHSSNTHSGVLHSGTSYSDNPNPLPLDAIFEQATGEMEWRCRFAVRQHFEDQGIRPFFTEVDVKFSTEGFYGTGGMGVERGQWHVPLLLGPHSFIIHCVS